MRAQERTLKNGQNSNEGITQKPFSGVWPSPLVVLECVTVGRGQIMKNSRVKSCVFAVDL